MTDEQSEQPETGTVWLYWVPHEADAERGNTRERLQEATAVEQEEGVTEYDEGLLLVHTLEGVAVFDRNHVRGWRTEGPVQTPGLERQETDAADGGDEGAE